MFEQSSQSYQYQYEPAPEPLKEGDPFYHYEIKNWELGPRIYKILAVSAVLNIALLLIVGQTSLLTMKGCDSPLVGTMCQALDTVYVGSMLFGTDREYVDAAYDKTELGDVDITYVDVTGLENQKLYYPADYFQIANPEKFDPTTGAPIDQFTDLSGENIPGITDNNNGFQHQPPGFQPRPSAPGHSIFDTPQHLPKTNPNPIAGPLPGADGSAGTPVVKKPRKNRPQPGDESDAEGLPGEDHTAQAKPSPSPSVEPTGPVADVEINKRPFVDLANALNPLLDAKQVNLEAPFQLTATGKLTKDGKLDPKTFAYGKQLGDPKMIEVVKEAIEALNASGYLQWLNRIDAKNLNLLVQQDDNNVTAMVETLYDNELRPVSMTTLLNGIINDKKKAKSNPDSSDNDKDDLMLLQNASVMPMGKKLVIAFTIPKANLQQMIQKKLAEQKVEPKQPNGNAATQPTGNTARN